MFMKTLLLIPIAFLLMTNHAHAQGASTPDLVIPVSHEDLGRVESANEYFLKRDGYFSKRKRVIQIDSEVKLLPLTSFGRSP